MCLRFGPDPRKCKKAGHSDRTVFFCYVTKDKFLIITFARSRGRFADKAGLAFAAMAAGQIGAHRVGSARSLEAFVYVDATRTRWSETVPAETLSVAAFGVVDAVEISFTVRSDVHLKYRATRVTLDKEIKEKLLRRLSRRRH